MTDPAAPHVAVLTSGGDAPGMNAAIRAVVRTAADLGWKASGVQSGFEGLSSGDFVPLDSRTVGGILHQGGTVLGSARYPAFAEVAERERAVDHIRAAGVDALVAIGGNGTQHGALALSSMGVRVVGVASTIDNDLGGADITIGVDTALNVCLESLDRLRVTAQSLGRVFLVEVMGRNSGYLAIMAALASGAEAVVIPEEPLAIDTLAGEILDQYSAKGFAIVVVAEGAAMRAEEIARVLRARPGFGLKVRVTVLGHVQRGGAPTAFDRILASRLGSAAVNELAAGRAGVVACYLRGDVALIPFAEALTKSHPDISLGHLSEALAR